MRVHTSRHNLELFHFEDILFVFRGLSLLLLHIRGSTQAGGGVTPWFVSLPHLVLINLLPVLGGLLLVLVARNGAEHVAKDSLDRGTGSQRLAKASLLLHLENSLGRNRSLGLRGTDARLSDADVLCLSEGGLVLQDYCMFRVLA